MKKKNDFIWIYKNRANQVTYCHRQNGTTRQEEGKKDAYIDRTDYSDPIMPVLCIHVCGGREMLHHLHQQSSK